MLSCDDSACLGYTFDYTNQRGMTDGESPIVNCSGGNVSWE